MVKKILLNREILNIKISSSHKNFHQMNHLANIDLIRLRLISLRINSNLRTSTFDESLRGSNHRLRDDAYF